VASVFLRSSMPTPDHYVIPVTTVGRQPVQPVAAQGYTRDPTTISVLARPG